MKKRLISPAMWIFIILCGIGMLSGMYFGSKWAAKKLGPAHPQLVLAQGHDKFMVVGNIHFARVSKLEPLPDAYGMRVVELNDQYSAFLTPGTESIKVDDEVHYISVHFSTIGGSSWLYFVVLPNELPKVALK